MLSNITADLLQVLILSLIRQTFLTYNNSHVDKQMSLSNIQSDDKFNLCTWTDFMIFIRHKKHKE